MISSTSASWLSSFQSNNTVSTYSFLSMAIDVLTYWIRGRNPQVSAQVQAVVDDSSSRDIYNPWKSAEEENEFFSYRYLRGNEPFDISERRYLTEAVGSEFQVSVSTGLYSSFPAVTTFSNGAYVVIWYNVNGNIYGQFFTSVADQIGKEFQVSSDTDSCPALTVAAFADGGFVVVWQNCGLRTISAQIFSAPFITSGASFEIADNTNSIAFVASDIRRPAVATFVTGGFVVAWTNSNGEIYGQLYTETGAKNGAVFNINNNNAAYNPLVATFANGEFVVAWVNNNREIYGQLYTAMGSPNDIAFQITSGPVSGQPSITALPNGFAVAWGEYVSQNGRITEYAMYGQIFDTSGIQNGPEFFIATGNSPSPTIAAFYDGGLAVTFFSINNNFGTINGQLVAATGDQNGGSFQINSDSNNDYSSTVAVFPNSPNFVVTWEGYNPIFFRR